MKHSAKTLLFTVLALASTFGYAAETNSAFHAQIQDAKPTCSPYINDQAWRFELIPYVWALSMNGRVGAGPVVGHLDQTFSDILEHLNFAAMLAIQATNDRFSAFFNVLYASLSMNGGNSLASLHVRNDFGLYSGGISYDVFRYPFNFSCNGNANSLITLAPYGGFRYTLNEVQATLNVPGVQVTSNLNEYWTDPIIGLRFNYDITHAWKLMLSGDVGGTNASSHYSYNAFGTIGYSPQTVWTNTTIYLGYRLLDQHYTTGTGLSRFDWNMKIFGPLVGLGIEF